jgi:hypothetical protein
MEKRLIFSAFLIFRLNKKQKKSFAEAKDSFFWQGRRDSNPQHPVLETGALPIELRP